MVSRDAIGKATAAVIILIIIVAVAGGAYYYSTLKPPAPTTVAHTSMIATSPTEQIKAVRLVYPTPPVGPSVIELYALEDMGYLAADGIKATISSQVGNPNAAKALLSGSVDIADLTPDGTISAIAAGGPVKGFAVWGLYQPFIPITTNNINSWQDIVGKRLGVTGVGTLTHQLWLGMLNAEHISTNDVHFVVAGPSIADQLKALIAGTVDGALIFSDLWTASANTTQVKNLHVFLPSLTEFFPFWSYHMLTATTSYIQAHPDVIQGITTALIKMTRDFQQNKTIFFRAVDTVFPDRYDTAAKEYIWGAFVKNGYFAVNGGLNYGKLNQLINYTYSVLNAKAADNPYIHGPSDVVYTSFVKHSLDELGVFKASWDQPDWYMAQSSKAPGINPKAGCACPSTPNPLSAHIKRILTNRLS